MSLLRLGFGRLFRRRREQLAEGRAAIARLGATIAKTTRQLTPTPEDLESEISGVHEIPEELRDDPRHPR